MENAVGIRVRELREFLNLSQHEFAIQIDTVNATISRMESGATPVSKKSIRKIIEAFGVSEKWLTKGEGEMEITEIVPIQKQTASSKTVEVLESKVEHLEKEIMFYRDLLLNLSHKVAANFNEAFGLAGQEITGKYQGKVIEMFAESVRVVA